MKERFARFIVAHSKTILIIFIILALGCGGLIPFVNINKDMTKYLPKDSAMRHGLDLMKAEFGDENASTLEVMFDDLKTPAQKTDVLQKLEAMKYADSVDYDPAEEDEDHFYNKDKYTRFVINCDYDQYSEEASVLWQNVMDEYVDGPDVDEDRNVVLGGTINAANKNELPLWIVVIAIGLVVLILLIMSSSWIEPLAFMITIGVAILINMGTYIFFPSISKTTFGIVAILQLGLSMDYSIMLLNRYRQQRKLTTDKHQAMREALSLSFGAITGSSLTTFAGLLALVFMSFTMGADIGLSLAKGVIISMLCIFTVLPALILGFDDLMLRTVKRTPPFDLPRLSGFMYKLRIPLTVLFAAMLIGSFGLRNGVDFSYAQSWLTEIDEVFGHTNTIVMVYDEKDGEKAGELADSLEDNPNVRSAVCYESTLGKQRLVGDMHDFIDDMQDEGYSDSADMDLSISMLKLIYYDYHAGDPEFAMTIPEFIAFLRGDVFQDPDFADSIDQETKDQINDMAKFTDRGELTTKKSAAGLADFFGMKKSQAEQLLLYYQINNNKDGDNMTLPDFVDFLIYDVATDSEYGKMISKSQLNQLKELQPFTDKDAMTTPLPYTETAQTLGMDESQMRLVYINHYAKAGPSSSRTIADLASVFSAMAADPALSAQFGGDDTAQLIGGLQQIGQMDPSSYDVAGMVQALEGYGMPLDAGTVAFAYAYGDLSSDPSAHTMSVQDVISCILADNSISSAMAAEQKEQLSTLQQIIDASVSGKKLSAKKMGSILGMKSSDVNKLYLLNQYNNGKTGSWKLTQQQFINFLVDKVLSDKSMKSKIGGNAADLRFAKKLINSVVAGTAFTHGEMADFFDDYSGTGGAADFDPDDLSMLYTLYGSRHYYDDTWTMDIMQLVTHLDENMIGRPAFAKNMDTEDVEDVHTMRSDMDEAAELLKGKHFGRMMITAVMDEDSYETRAFMDDLTGWTGGHFNGDSYLIGNTPMAYEMSKSFHHELNKITLITALFILFIVLMTFRRLATPIVLVLLIQCAVFLTMAALNCLHVDMQYLALLIVQSIMMGATIDYAIIYTTYYIENRSLGVSGGSALHPRDAIRAAYKGSLQTILTSATILTAAVGVLSFAFYDPSIRQICRILSIGCLIATVLVIFILPAILSCLDRFIVKRKA